MASQSLPQSGNPQQTNHYTIKEFQLVVREHP